MVRSVAKKRRKLMSIGILTLIIIIIATAKLIRLHQDSAWQDLSDTVPSITTPTMNIDQIEGSLEDISKQYEGVITHSSQASKNQMISNLDRLYQLSVTDYVNANALKNLSNNACLTI
ncbi:hypothetical protein [Desulfosporosinus sp. FKB]|uniref:hypothetical protein n=1 Tax=Desulfosporosinus sp. FKB TaxID=1969835 RepID=UPI000B49C71C|nr:hypothetical protein [Desulfosporosinus sp. FKB]